jgi:hypothetical protein
MTCDATKPNCVEPRPYSALRGIGGTRIPNTNRIATAVAQEELVFVASRPNTHSLGHILAHEFGHTVLDFASAVEKGNVNALLDANGPGHDYVGLDAYTSSNGGEYFAQGTAALFGFEYGPQYASEYTRQWLFQSDPALLTLLRRVYPTAP